MCKSKGGGDWELISYSQEMYLLGIVVPCQKILHGKQQAANVGLILIGLSLLHFKNYTTKYYDYL